MNGERDERERVSDSICAIFQKRFDKKMKMIPR
jgi:hypothetical protein